MNDDDQAALAFQLELEGRQWQEELAKDPAYELWLDELSKEFHDH